jgi:iron complex transport system permease protein
MNVPRARRWHLPVLVAAAVASVAVALALGSVAVPPQAWTDVFRGADSPAAAVLWQLRLPRALSAFAVGGLLALAGALLQALLRNPLADPYVLGISGGAAVAGLLALMAGAGLAGMQLASAGGALVTLALLFMLARRALFGHELRVNDEAAAAILLTGVMLAAFAAATLSLLLALAPDGTLRPMVFWLLGDLSAATDLRLALGAAMLLAAGLAVALGASRALNLMLRGDAQALTQGVAVERVRRVLVVVAALATAGAVTLAGAVGFVGFVAPHIMRRWVGNDQRVLLPCAVLAGGVLVVLADTAARSIAAPLQLPVGVLTALIGVPVFLWLVRHR